MSYKKYSEWRKENTFSWRELDVVLQRGEEGFNGSEKDGDQIE